MKRPGKVPKLRQVARNHEERFAVIEDDQRRLIVNERLTRARVDTIEAFFAMSFRERLWWVLTGRSKYFTVEPVLDAADIDELAAESDAQRRAHDAQGTVQ